MHGLSAYVFYVEVKVDDELVHLDEADGWTVSERTVTLQNGACATLQSGAVHALAIHVRCELLL